MSSEQQSISLSHIESEQLHWLWEKRISRGKLTTLDGDPGLGKSLITLDLAARITTGRPMPDGTPGIQGSVVLIAPEDGVADTIKPRIEAAGGDPSHIHILNFVKDTRHPERFPVHFTLSKHLPVLVRTVLETNAALVILDPFLAILGSDFSVYNDQKIREKLSYLSFMAECTKCAVLIVRHLNKGNSNNPFYRGSGSIGIIATVRTGLLVVQHPSDENKRLLVSSKNNLSEKPDNLVYQVISNADDAPSIQWLGTNHDPVTSLLKGNTSLSLERQDILKVLQSTNRPLGPKELAEQTGQNRTLVRQLLRRMLNAGDIISPAYGLYTTHHHPSLATFFSQNNEAAPTTPATPATPTTLATPLDHS